MINNETYINDLINNSDFKSSFHLKQKISSSELQEVSSLKTSSKQFNLENLKNISDYTLNDGNI